MMVDKNFCLSSYMAYRYIYKDGVDFAEGLHHELYKPIPEEDRIPVKSAEDIDREIQKQFDSLYKKHNKIGILLSGGMDSAILATYLKPGSNAYTFKTNLQADVFNLDEERAEKYCKKLGLNHIFVDIDFDDYKKYSPIVMKAKCAPVHSIEPQIYKAAILAMENGDELIIVGESSDLIFGGMDGLLAKDWTKDEFIQRYTFLNPDLVLSQPDDSVFELYDKYEENGVFNFQRFVDEIFSVESSSSYFNAFGVAEMPYYDPYAKLIMADELDLERVRNGEPKYLIRQLFAMKYPEIEIPNKIPMPRPVDVIFEKWDGPKREEFRKDIDMSKLTGNQKWQLWCAEKFLDMISE